VRLDPFTVVLIAVVTLASLFPCEGQVAVWFGLLTKLAVALLFFMHGAKLSRQNLLAGLGHWRLHLVVMLSTFVLFPLLGLLLTPLVPSWLSPAIYLGFLYLCALPATVQSAIAFTSMAGGNVSAAVCSASASSSRRCWWG
jgi:sodium/bile acid cotransporter 7